MPVVSTIPCSTPYAAILPLAASVLLSEDKEQLKERIEVLAKGGGKDDSDQ